jgi:hypothetical protein
VESVLPVLKDISEGNIADFTIRVHALKSASANVGAIALSNEAALLEESGKVRDLRAILDSVGGFRERLIVLVSRIREAVSLVNVTDKNEEETGGMPAVSDLLKLKGAISSRNIGESDSLLDELSSMPLSDRFSDALSLVSNHLLLSDFEEAEGIVDNLLEEAGL